MQNTEHSPTGGAGNKVPITSDNLEQYVISLLPKLVPLATHCSDDLKIFWPSRAPLAIEAAEFTIVVWDEGRQNVIKLIPTTGENGRIRTLQELTEELDGIISMFNLVYELGLQRGMESR